ncbi:hypothetical protein A8B84_14035 [Marinobacter sp. EhC06]|uniref:restriction endonuclease subunit S n=1 Tax=Marinobacter TaxID=2742 RepID=UPI0007D9BEFD|nr:MULTISPECIES: restriction endonuclease subunit S [unclassified Marinobacter]OAN87867.1 hypothetical protein A8B84_14035 [Marinobacter sp. EhC06]OAN90962.1 hypothetical protein A8B80_20420 [Marinobacter sp. EhN04]
MTSFFDSELPPNWELLPISEVAEVNPKFDKRGIADDLEVTFIPMPAVEAETGFIDASGVRCFGQVKKGYTGFLEGDVLFAKITPCMENGKMAVVPAMKNGVGFGSTEFHVLRPGPNLDSKFLYYFVSSKQVRFDAEHNMSGAVGQKRVPAAYLVGYRIPVPSIDQQKRIVSKIEEIYSELDNGISALKTARKQLKVYRQAVLKHAFEGKLTAKWREKNAGKLEYPQHIVARIQWEREARYQQQSEDWKAAVELWKANGKLGRKPGSPKKLDVPEAIKLPLGHYLADMPKEWVCIKARHLCDFITKGTTPAKSELFSGEGDVPFIKVYNLTKSGRLDFTIDPTYVTNDVHQRFLCRSKVFPGDVLMNIVGPPLGKVSIVPDSFKEWNINQAIAIYRSKILKPKYLSEFLLFEKTVNFMMAQSKATAGQFNLTLEICRELPIPVPSMEEQYEIVSRIEEKLSNLDFLSIEIERQLSKSETLRQSILKKAFSGQLVPQDPDDEPASELLDRIRAEKQKGKQTGRASAQPYGSSLREAT